MKTEIQKKINELHAALKEHASNEAVTFSLFINCEEVRVEIAQRTYEQLNSGGISMRNLRGEFIKAPTP